MKKAISFSLCLIVLLTSLLIPASASSAELVSPPDNPVFYEGTDWVYSGSAISPKSDFDLTGTVVKYNGNNISYHVFPWGGNMMAEPSDGSWKTGKNKVKIYLDDFDGVFVESELTLVAIKKIELSKAPAKTELVHGADWDYDALGNIALKTYSPEGAAIKLTYTDNSTAIVNYEDGGIDWIVPGDVENFELGVNEFELTYFGKSVPFEVKFVLEKISGSTLKSKPGKLNYDFKTDWSYSADKIVPVYDFSGLKVKITYSNGTSEEVAYSSEPNRFKITTPATATLGTNKIKATVDGQATVEFDIVIRGYGDIDNDGKINSQDALSVLQYSVSLVKFNVTKYKYANVTGDKQVNSSDALAILQKSVGKVKYFQAELV